MKFHYHKSTKRRGIEGFVMCTIFSVMFGSAWFYLLFLQEKEAGIIFGHVIGWFSIILMSIMYLLIGYFTLTTIQFCTINISISYVGFNLLFSA